MGAKPPDPRQNTLLASLPDGERSRLGPKFRLIELPVGTILPLHNPDAAHVYFPLQGMISLVRRMLDGAMVEVGVIGREGVVGMTPVLGGDITIVERMVQMSGSALRVPTRELQAELDRYPALKARLLSFSQALIAQLTQIAACNGRHHVQERLARWLLMARDRVDNDTLPLSHEFLSVMLGVRRPGVTVVLGALRKAGLVESHHGKIEILDHAGLKDAACECYGEISEVYRRLLQAA